MSVLDRLRGAGRGRRGLRRISPERAKLAERSTRAPTFPAGGEKLAIGLAAALVATWLLGLGLELDTRRSVGVLALVLVAGAFFVRYQLDFRRHALHGVGRVFALALLVLTPLALARVFEGVLGERELAFLPLALVSLVLALAWDRALALEATLLAGALLGLDLLVRPGAGDAAAGLAVCLAGGVAACLAAEHVKRRATLVRVGVTIGVVQMLVAGGLALLGVGPEEVIERPAWLALLGLEGLAVGLVASGSLPAIELAFGVTTDVSLLELGNTHEQPLLRKLLVEAPGTFHHSYVVGLISEAAAEAVGANALLARVGALYHDVGKLNKPGYFAENSTEARGRHRELTPEMSTLIISAHTRDGVELGAYYGLPQAVLDFMPEHHGTSCIEYFFHAAKKLRGADHVNENNFRYPGPRPQRIETAIVMIADAVEAISRQMPDPTRARLEEMVHEVALKRLMDRQFDECGMTLRDLTRIEAAAVRVLGGIYHTRPTYPKGKPHPLDLSQPAGDRRAAAPRPAGAGEGEGERVASAAPAAAAAPGAPAAPAAPAPRPSCDG